MSDSEQQQHPGGNPEQPEAMDDGLTESSKDQVEGGATPPRKRNY